MAYVWPTTDTEYEPEDLTDPDKVHPHRGGLFVLA